MARKCRTKANCKIAFISEHTSKIHCVFFQAEERLLRNLSVEVADPPLGYPCYTSSDIRHGLEYF